MVRSLTRIVVLLVGAILAWRIALWLSPLVAGAFPRASHLVFAILVTLLALALVWVIPSLISEEPQDRRARTRSALRSFTFGILHFAVPFMFALGACIAAGLLTLTTDASATTLVLSAAAVFGLVFLAEAFPEELIFRGAILGGLRGILPAWTAIVAQAVFFTLFGWMVGAATSLMDLSFLFSFGMVLGVLRSSIELPAAIGFHWAFMSTQQFFGSAWNLVELSRLDLFQTLVCAVIPFSAAIIVLHKRVK